MEKMWTMEQEAENLKMRFEGVRRTVFAKTFNVPGGAAMIYQHINGLRPIGMDAARAYARGFGCTIQDISPRLHNEVQALVADQNLANYNIEPAAAQKDAVPLISWVAAGDFIEVQDPFEVGQAEDWIETSVKIKKHTFALRVKGDSMTAPTGTSFPEGMIIIVEPEMHPESGDYVIAKNGDNEATFKQLIKDGGDWYLKPLHPRYPMKALGDARVIGVVREAVIKFR